MGGKKNKRGRTHSGSSNPSPTSYRPLKTGRFDALLPSQEEESEITMNPEQIQQLVAEAVQKSLQDAKASKTPLDTPPKQVQRATILHQNPTTQDRHDSIFSQATNANPMEQVSTPSEQSQPFSTTDLGLAGLVAEQVIKSLVPMLNTAISTAIQTAVKQVVELTAERVATRATETLGAQLQKHSLLLKYETDRLEQYSRRWTLRIHGMKESDDETTEQLTTTLVKLGNECGVHLEPSDISVCHRVGPKKSRDGQLHNKRAVLCRFISRNTRNQVLEGKKKLRDNDEFKGVYVNEDLTQLRARLFAKARNHPTVNNAITRDGRILCYLSEARHVRPVVIETPDDLFKLGETSVDYGYFGLKDFVLASDTDIVQT